VKKKDGFVNNSSQLSESSDSSISVSNYGPESRRIDAGKAEKNKMASRSPLRRSSSDSVEF
jgi:hypothetical protein